MIRPEHRAYVDGVFGDDEYRLQKRSLDLELESLVLPEAEAPMFTSSSNGRNLGAAAALLGDHDEARAHYQVAPEVLAKIRHRSELALTRLELAELLLAHDPDERAKGP